MTRFLAEENLDENLNNQIVRGVIRQSPDVDIMRVQTVENISIGIQRNAIVERSYKLQLWYEADCG